MNLVLIFFVFIAAALVVAVIDRIRIERRLKQIEKRAANAVPFWRGLQAIAIRKLKHPHKEVRRVNELLDLLEKDDQISEEDFVELFVHMRAVAVGEDPEITGEEEKALAELLPIIIVQAQREAMNPSPITDVQLFGIKADPRRFIDEFGPTGVQTEARNRLFNT